LQEERRDSQPFGNRVPVKGGGAMRIGQNGFCEIFEEETLRKCE
jgi:hypothetical protein